MNPYIFFGIGIPIIIAIQIFIVCLKHYFEKNIVRDIRRGKIKAKQLKDIEFLYDCYKKMSAEQLILSKLKLQAKDSPVSFLKDVFNIMSTLIIGAMLFFSGLLINTSMGLLNLIFENDEFKKNMDEWTMDINALSRSISNGINTTTMIIVILFILAGIIIQALNYYNQQKNIIRKHLSIIEQAEKDLSNSLNAYPAAR